MTSIGCKKAFLGAYIKLAHSLAGNGTEKNDIGKYAELIADPDNNLALLSSSPTLVLNLV